MTSPHIAVPTEELPKDVADLAAAVAALPAEARTKLEPLMFRVVDSTKRRRRILNLVQEALSQLRLDMKYLVFDLEATRRERDALRHGTTMIFRRGNTNLRGAKHTRHTSPTRKRGIFGRTVELPLARASGLCFDSPIAVLGAVE
jgi:hypothetical protein